MRLYAEILRELREDSNLKQADIAQILGTTQQYYSKYETGKFDPPLRMLLVLADFYHVSIDYIVGRTDCRDTYDVMNEVLESKHSVGKVVNDIQLLSKSGQRSVIEYVGLIKLKEKVMAQTLGKKDHVELQKI